MLPCGASDLPRAVSSMGIANRRARFTTPTHPPDPKKSQVQCESDQKSPSDFTALPRFPRRHERPRLTSPRYAAFRPRSLPPQPTNRGARALEVTTGVGARGMMSAPAVATFLWVSTLDARPPALLRPNEGGCDEGSTVDSDEVRGGAPGAYGRWSLAGGVHDLVDVARSLLPRASSRRLTSGRSARVHMVACLLVGCRTWTGRRT
jgi:hypothetical protein